MIIQRNWLNFWFGLVVIASLTSLEPLGRSAEVPPVCDPVNPKLCSQPMEKGQVATFPGQLLTLDLALDLGQKAMHCKEQVAFEVNYTKKLAEIDLSLEKSRYAIDRATWEVKEKLLNERLVEAKTPLSWYEKPLAIIIMTGIVTAGLCYGMFQVANHSQ